MRCATAARIGWILVLCSRMHWRPPATAPRQGCPRRLALLQRRRQPHSRHAPTTYCYSPMPAGTASRGPPSMRCAAPAGRWSALCTICCRLPSRNGFAPAAARALSSICMRCWHAARTCSLPASMCLDRCRHWRGVKRLLTCLPPAGVATGGAGLVLTDIERCAPFFLCVATLEPRKQHGLLLDAIEAYWAGGGAANLLLVGAPGWCSDALFARVRNHPQNGRRLHWLQTLGDAGLAALYREALAMVYLSRTKALACRCWKPGRRAAP